jgi:PAS domain S-box-containing protein
MEFEQISGLRRAFEGSAVGMSVTDLSGRFVLANEAYSRITGFSEQELRSTDYQLVHK